MQMREEKHRFFLMYSVKSYACFAARTVFSHKYNWCVYKKKEKGDLLCREAITIGSHHIKTSKKEGSSSISTVRPSFFLLLFCVDTVNK